MKFDVHRICGISDITFFIFLETTSYHVIKEPCDSVRDGPSSKSITFSSLLVMNLVEREIQYFLFFTLQLCHMTTVGGDQF